MCSAINHVYVFNDLVHLSIIRHFNCADKHRDIIRAVGLFDQSSTLHLDVYRWCTQCISWRGLQALIIEFLQEGLQSDDDISLILANTLNFYTIHWLLYFLLPSVYPELILALF